MTRHIGIGALLLTVIFAGLGFARAGAEGEQVHESWGYGVGNGPSLWAKISPEFETCNSGQRQSPIDLGGEHPPATQALTLDYHAGPASIINLGHTVQVKVAPGSKLFFDGASYELLQFHFHTPSENTFHGMHFPTEVHFVHRSENGGLAVVALMVRPGDEGAMDALPVVAEMSEEESLGDDFEPASLLPNDLSYLTFEGSLTTPPCSEGVRWIVLRETVSAQSETHSRLAEILGRNNRPINPLNGREVQASR